MLFKSRHPTRVRDQVRRSVWPPRAWGRVTRYVWHRTARIEDSSHSIALGFALGVFAAFTPFVGIHTVLAMLCAWVLGGNILASAVGAQTGNPLTLPFIWLTTYETGRFFVQDAAPSEPVTKFSSSFIDWTNFSAISHILLPMFVGSMIWGLVAAAICYFPVKAAVVSYQRRRIERRLTRVGNELATAPEHIVDLNGPDGQFLLKNFEDENDINGTYRQ